MKEEVGAYMQQWYRNTHGVNCASNAEDMSVILEAYWILAAKRCVQAGRRGEMKTIEKLASTASLKHGHRDRNEIRDRGACEHPISGHLDRDLPIAYETYEKISSWCGGRFVDQVCMVIDRDVMGGLPSKIHEEMYRNVNDDARLQAYFEEDKQVRPMHLIGRQRRLRGCIESVCLGVDVASRKVATGLDVRRVLSFNHV